MQKNIRILLVSFLPLFLCCQRHTESWEDLSHADSVIEDYPDSAYSILQEINVGKLSKGEERAYYALLMSMAIDKQYIDLTTDSIIAPAATYYKHRGNNDNRMRTAYYRARVAENSGDDEETMRILIENLKFAKRSDYHLFKGRYYIKIAALYSKSYDFEPAFRYADEAKNEYRLSGRVKNYVTGLLMTSNYLQQLQDFKAAEAELDTVRMLWSKIDDHRKGAYYRQRINIDRLFKGEDGAYFREECISEGLVEKEIPYLPISESYLSAGRIEDAELALKQFAKYHPDEINTQIYQYQLYAISRAKENYQDALEAERKYRLLGEHKQLQIINSDTRFIEERFESKLKRQNGFGIIVTLSLFLIATVLGSLLIYRRIKSKHQRIESMYHTLQEEKLNLEKMLNHQSLFDEDNISVIKSRLEIINSVLISRFMGKPWFLKDSEKKLQKISQDSKEVMLTTASLFSCSHPEFISFLKGKGLSSKECGYCCMFLLGFDGKEINSTFFKGSAYKFSSGIRKKLGLDNHDSNIGIYLKNIASGMDRN